MTAPAFDYPDVEAALVAFLSRRLPGVHVGTRVPHKRPDTFMRARVITPAAPSPRGVPITEPTVLVEAWAPTDVGASDLARKAWGEVADAWGEWLDAAQTVWCYGVEPAGVIAYPDPDTKSPRYQFTALMTLNLRDKD